VALVKGGIVLPSLPEGLDNFVRLAWFAVVSVLVRRPRQWLSLAGKSSGAPLASQTFRLSDVTVGIGEQAISEV